VTPSNDIDSSRDGAGASLLGSRSSDPERDRAEFGASFEAALDLGEPDVLLIFEICGILDVDVVSLAPNISGEAGINTRASLGSEPDRSRAAPELARDLDWSTGVGILVIAFAFSSFSSIGGESGRISMAVLVLHRGIIKSGLVLGLETFGVAAGLVGLVSCNESRLRVVEVAECFDLDLEMSSEGLSVL